MDNFTIQRCVKAGISSEQLRSIELETGSDPVTIVLVLVAAQKIGWRPPRNRADVQLLPKLPSSNPFNVLEGDR